MNRNFFLGTATASSVLLIVSSLSLLGCSQVEANPPIVSFKDVDVKQVGVGVYSIREICYNGFVYIQFDRGIAPKYSRDPHTDQARVESCDPAKFK